MNSPQPAALIVEDDAAMRALLADELQDRGFAPTLCDSLEQATALAQERAFDVVITDMNLKRGSGLDVLRVIHAHDPDTPVILITAFGTMQAAIEAMRHGVYDFITKPFDFDYLSLVCSRAIEHRALRHEVAALRLAAPLRGELDGEGRAFRRLLDRLEQVAPTRATILLHGESGTGKTRLARVVHQLSPRAQGPLIIENVAALPESLLESELFGHAKGAFTGADQAKKGLFERAHGGTLVLDEIAELPLSLQAKLLQAIETRAVRPVGAAREVLCDVRLIAATHRDLPQQVRAGHFREDLYFRLAVIELEIPPLRERGRDVLVLAQRFALDAAREFDKPVCGLSPELARALLSYPWPGNLRELKHAMEQAVLMARSDQLVPADLPERVLTHASLTRTTPQAHLSASQSAPLSDDALDALETLEQVERRHILAVLDAAGGNKARAARILDVGRKTLYRKLEAWGVDVSE